MNNNGYIGMVYAGRFRPLVTERQTADFLRLTTLTTSAAQLAESAEVPLSTYEGSVVMVRGVDRGEWIYSAIIVDQAGPILTAVINHIFGAAGKPGHGQLKNLLM